jgi:dolichol-phosphate mannosyltransferase
MIYILIPIFNEEGNIANLHRELSSILPNEEKMFVFSDDGSSDKTIDLLKSHFSNTNFTVLGDGLNRGPGYAFNTGFEWVLANSKNIEKDIVITMEADCTSDITILSHMLAINRMGYDLVLASVYAQGGGFDSTSFIRKFLSSIANLLFRFLFDIKVLTLSSFYRVYSVSLLQKIKQNNSAIITEYGFICMLEILVKAIKQDAKMIEVPMMLKSTKRVGKSKLKVFKTTMAYFRFLLFKKK